MAHYRGWVGGRGGLVGGRGRAGEEGGWEAGGELNPSLGPFGLAMGIRSASQCPNMLEWR